MGTGAVASGASDPIRSRSTVAIAPSSKPRTSRGSLGSTASAPTPGAAMRATGWRVRRSSVRISVAGRDMEALAGSARPVGAARGGARWRPPGPARRAARAALTSSSPHSHEPAGHRVLGQVRVGPLVDRRATRRTARPAGTPSRSARGRPRRSASGTARRAGSAHAEGGQQDDDQEPDVEPVEAAATFRRPGTGCDRPGTGPRAAARRASRSARPRRRATVRTRSAAGRSGGGPLRAAGERTTDPGTPSAGGAPATGTGGETALAHGLSGRRLRRARASARWPAQLRPDPHERHRVQDRDHGHAELGADERARSRASRVTGLTAGLQAGRASSGRRTCWRRWPASTARRRRSASGARRRTGSRRARRTGSRSARGRASAAAKKASGEDGQPDEQGEPVGPSGGRPTGPARSPRAAAPRRRRRPGWARAGRSRRRIASAGRPAASQTHWPLLARLSPGRPARAPTRCRR